VETIRALVSAEEASKPSFAIPVARRELLEITGISKQGNLADVEFIWKWAPLNEVGAALYSGELRYKSTVGFRDYDDGWRLVQTSPHSGQTLDDALKNAELSP
jgi:carbohydrate-selective porin OprB